MNILNLKIGLRLSLGFALVLLLMVVLTATSFNSMTRIQERLDTIVDTNDHEMDLVQTMSESVHIVARVVRTLVLLTNENEINAEMRKITEARTKYDAAFEELEKMPASEAGKVIHARMKEAALIAKPLNDKVITLARSGNDAEATALLMKESGPAVQKWQDVLSENIDLQREGSKHEADAAHAAYKKAVALMLTLGAASLVLAALVAWFITQSITKPINNAVTFAKAVAAGDLTQSIVVDSKDETGQLLQALKDMNASLVKIVGEVRGGTDTIATASQQIASGNADLSSRTEEQASSLEETASSMEELTSTVKQNADNARQANGLAVTASEVAIKGGAVVSEVVDTMGEINDSARKIVDIIGVIDGIAFQTNILALNAAVEAARAGEQGRGFAVVASEVRNLAQRSAAAAKEIKVLIGNSVEKVDVGSKLVDQAGATMQEVVESIRRVTDIMGEITAASQEQSAGIEQVNQAIAQMDEVTQQNAALVEEAAAASESMQEQAGSLAQVVGVFRLDRMQQVAVATPARVATKPAAHVAPLAKKRVPAVRASAQPLQVKRGASAGTGSGDDWEEF